MRTAAVMLLLMMPLILPLTLPLVGCGEPNIGGATGTGTPTSTELLVDALVEPTDATEIRAPQNTFVVGTWRSMGNWIKLIDLVAEGAIVEEGDVVARFENEGERALPWVRDQISRAESDAERSRIDREATERRLALELQQRGFEQQRSAIELRRAGVIAQRTLDAYRLDHELAAFATDAATKRIGASASAAATEAEYQRLSVQRANRYMEQHAAYVAKFSTKAPHAGVVRHAYNHRRRRRLKKGDGFPSGMHVLSIARSPKLGLRVLIPEHLIGNLAPGSELIALGPEGEDIPIRLSAIEPMPQELGFLRRDDKLPNAREKAYTALAEFVSEDVELTAGIDIKVRIP